MDKVMISIKNLTIMLPDPPVRGVELPAQFAETSRFIPPSVGSVLYDQGGVLAGIMPPEDGKPGYYLIVPTNPAAEAEALEWGPYETKIEGLDPRDGKTNTELLARADSDHPAAEFCAGLSLNGHSDYYLPSRREASLMAATVPHLFKEGWHWTSTQPSADSAFVQDFSGGHQGYYSKNLTLRVRAVRRFLIETEEDEA